MGCDIHLTIECKNNRGRWMGVRVGVFRDYRLFGLLAGVRDPTIRSLSKPRGKPNPASLTFVKDLKTYGSDAHSTSYLSFEELLGVDWEDTKLNKLGCSFFIQDVLVPMRNLANIHGEDNVRICFFFDN